MAHSVLQVPVREAEPLVRPRWTLAGPDFATVDDTVVAHITLLGPFVDEARIDEGILGELRAFFDTVLPFGFRLTDVCAFPSGTTYLSPDPAAPFRLLTQGLLRNFPEFPPYGGAFESVVPHLSVPLGPDEDLDSLTEALAPSLPLSAHAVEAALVWYDEGATRTLATFPFGTSAA